MSELQLFSILFVGGVIGHLFLRCSANIYSLILTGHWHSYMTLPKGQTGFLNNKGEAATENKVEFTAEQQKALDAVVQERLARERAKYSDYEDLRKFKSEYEKSQEQKNQQELENAKKYEEAKKGYETKINEYGQIVSKKDQEIIDLRKTYELSSEISKHGGFIEESIALLKNNTILDANGQVKIKTKDANGMDVELPLTDGIKKFYEQRPHLVKSTFKSGAGTGANDGGGTGAGAGSGQAEDLNSLNAELVQAMRGTDLKRISDIKTKIKAAMLAKGTKR